MKDEPALEKHYLLGTWLAGWGQQSRRWLSAHWGVAVAALVNLTILFLPFYDTNNIPLALATSSHFTSYAPGFVFNRWVAGPFINAAYVPEYLAYVGSGFQLYWAYTALKAIFFISVCCLTWTLYKAFESRGLTVANRIAIFTLANPVWLYLNYVWVEYDIIPVTFLALGFVLLRYCRWGPMERARIPVSILALMVSVFFYWFALAIIPTLAIFARSKREGVSIFVWASAMFVLLLAVTVFLLSGDLSLYASTLLGTNSGLNRAQSFGLQYFVRIPPVEYIALLCLLVIGAPLALRWSGASEEAAAFVVLSVLIFSAPIPLPDNYVAVFPFAVLALLRVANDRIRWSTLFGLIAFPAVGLFLINFLITNAQPDGVGLFFFGYDLFHLNFHFIQTYPQQLLFEKWFNVAVLVALLGSFLVLARVTYSAVRPRAGGGSEATILAPANRTSGPPTASSPVSKPGVRPHLVAWASVLIVLALASVLFNGSYANLVDYKGSGPAPTYVLTPLFWPDNGNIPRPIAGQTFTQQGPVLSIARGAPPMTFGRWYFADGFRIGGSVALSGIVPGNARLVNGTPYELSLLNLSQPDLAGGAALTPSLEGAVTNSSSPLLLLNSTNQTYSLDGNSSLVFDLNQSAFVDRYYAFAFNISSPGLLQTNIVHVQDSGNFFAVVRYPGQDLLVYGGAVTGGKFVSVNISGLTSLDQWQYLVFYPTDDALWVDLSGSILDVPVDLFPSGSTEQIRLGVPFAGGQYNYSLAGEATGLYFQTAEPTTIDENFLEVYEPGYSLYSRLAAFAFSFNLTSTRTETSLTVDGNTYTAAKQTTAFYIGKIDSGNYGVTIRLSYFAMYQLAPNNLYLIPVFWTCAAPFVVLVEGVWWLRRLQVRTGPGPTPD